LLIRRAETVMNTPVGELADKLANQLIVFVDSLFFLLTIIAGLWPVLRAARGSHGG